MRNNHKWLLAFGAVGILCFCAGVSAFLVFGWGMSQVTRSVQTDPARVASVGQRIADFDIPPGYKEAVAMSFFSYDFVTIAPDTLTPGASASSDMTIMLMQFNSGLADPAQMQRALEQQSGQGGVNMKVVTSYKTIIRGQQSTVTISDGDIGQGITVRQLITIFRGKSGMVMLMIEGTRETWDQSLADQFIASIR